MGFGTGPYGVGAFGAPVLDEPAPVVTSFVTSQEIDGKSMDYVLWDDGNHKGMDDTMQRVLLLISFGVKRPSLIGPEFESDMRNQVIAALAPVLKSNPPAIEILSLTVDTDRDASFISLKYRNLITGSTASVTI